MKIQFPVIIKGTGTAVPSEQLSNADFEAYLDTSDEWITQRTGIKTRYKAAQGETTVSLAAEAGRRAISDAGLEPKDIDLIILCTATPEVPIPSTACMLQSALDIPNVPAFDVSAACSGLLYGVIIGSNMMASGRHQNVLVVGAEVLTRFCDFEDRTTCVLFGDAAAALVLSQSPDPQRGFLHTDMGADGSMWDYIWVPAGGTRDPATSRTVNEKLHFIRMRGRELYKVAIVKMQSLIDEALAKSGLTADQLAMVLPHQSNLRIIESVRHRLNLPREKIAVNINRFGNTSAASIGLALDESRRNGKLNDGDLVLMVAFGAGVTWATIVARL